MTLACFPTLRAGLPAVLVLTLALAAPVAAQQASGDLHIDWGRLDTGPGSDSGWLGHATTSLAAIPPGGGLGWAIGLDLRAGSIGKRDLDAAPYAEANLTFGANRLSAGILRSAADKVDLSPLVRGNGPELDRFGPYTGIVTNANLADGAFFYGLGYDGSFGALTLAGTVQKHSASGRVETEIAAAYDLGGAVAWASYQNFRGSDLAAVGVQADRGRWRAGARLGYSSAAADHQHVMLFGDLDLSERLNLAANVQVQDSDETLSLSGRYGIGQSGHADLHLVRRDSGDYAGLGLGFSF